jgi:gliding motility-associated-like protein
MVNPTSVITSSATDNWCNNVPNTYTATSSSSTATFAWTRAVVGGISNTAGSGSTATITETLINTTTNPIDVVYIITPSVNGCSGTSFNLTVTVNPTAEVDQSVSQVICNGENTTAVIYTTVNTGGVTTYSWTNSDISIGLAASGNGDVPSFVATNPGTSPVVATIVVTPHFSNGGKMCDGPTKTFTITINPTAEVDQPVSQVVCNGENTSTVTFITTGTGGMTTYSWTNDQPTIGLPATGSGNIASFVATNPGSAPVIATIIVTPHFSNGGKMCDGPTKTFTITVNPTAEVDLPVNQVVCNGENTSMVPFITTGTGGVTTYSWTNDQPTIGLPATGSGNIASFVATNPGTAPVIATIVVTPHFSSGGKMCDGPTKTFTITVNPTAEVDQPVSQVVCNGENTTTVTFATVNTGGVTTYSWTNSDISIGLAASGNDNIPSFVATNPGTAPVIATIVVTPHFSNGGKMCDGPTKTFSITVNPTAEVDLPVNQVVCNGENTSMVTFITTGTGGVTTYSWTNDQPTIGLPATGSGNIASFIATNPGTAPVIATIVVTPHFSNGGKMCDGPTKTFTITVNPTAEVNQPVSQVVCNGENTSMVTFITTGTGGVTTYSWTNDQPTIGLPVTGSGNIASFVATNPGTVPIIATIVVTPHFSNGGKMCDGPTKTFTITVNPTAEVNQPVSQVVCNGENTSMVTFITTGTGGVTTYSWTNDQPTIGLPVTGSGNIASFVATNPGTVPVIATIVVTPHFSNGGKMCDGPTKTFTITVNPTAEVDQPVSQVICNGENTSTVTFITTGTGGVTTYTWTNNTPSIGLAASGNGDIQSFVATNPGTAPLVATIVVTPHFSNGGKMCDGPTKTFTITVNPTAEVNQPVSQVVCNGENTSTVTFITTGTGGVTTYSWTNDQPTIGLPATGSGNIASFVATNPGSAPVIATIIVTPHFSNGGKMCDGPTKTFTITVNPTAEVDLPVNQVVCNGENTSTVAFITTGTGGVTTYTWTNSNTSIGLPAGGNGDIPSFVATNPGTAPVVSTIVVTPHFSNGGKMCDGPTKTFTITVNPTAEVNQPVSQVVCNGENTSTVTFTTSGTGGVTSYTWTNSNISIGLAASGSGNISSFAATNPGNAPVAATIIVTPHFSYGGKICDGPTKTFTITVNPTAEVDQPVSQIVCNGGNTTAVTFATTGTGGVTTYTWINNNISIGLAASGSGNIPSFVTTNTGNSPLVAKITVTPHFSNGSKMCDGPAKIFQITVNPTPQVVLIPSSGYTICNEGTTSIVLSSPSSFTSGYITFNYTAVGSGAPGDITGFTASASGRVNNFTISETLVNHTDISQTVTYTIIPISPTGCAAGPGKTIIVTVEPTLQIAPITLSQTICNDGITNVRLYSPTIFSGGRKITFNYTVVATGGVTGFITPSAGLPNDSYIINTLHNPTDTFQTVTYRVTPISPTCSTSDPDKIIVITVNPTPRIFPVPANTSQCDSTVSSIRLQSPSTFTTGYIMFDYTASSYGAVTGYTSSLSGLPNNYVIADRLKNGTDTYQIVTYRIVPVNPVPGCANGIAQNISDSINPTPRAVLLNSIPAICYAGTLRAPVNTQIILNSPTVMTRGAIRFDYNVSVTGGPGVIVGNTSPATNLLPGYAINLTYQNNSDTLQSVYYNVTPKVNNAICSPGKTVTSKVSVHALPVQRIDIIKQLTCVGTSGNAKLQAIISKGADPYQIDWKGPVGYHKADSLLISNLSNGKYVITVIDNLGCNRKDSVSIIAVTARPNITPDIKPPGNYNISCIGSTDGAITVSVNGGITAPYNYWVVKNDVDTLYSGILTNNFNPLDLSTFRYYTNLGAGSYTLIIKDINGCQALYRIVFRVPPPVVVNIQRSSKDGGFNISCKGYNDGSAWIQSISGGRGPFTYRWYTSDGLIPGAINTNRIDNLIAGTYYLEIKDVLGCITTATVLITEPNGMLLAGSSVSRSPDSNFNISCNGGNDGSIALNITGGSGNYIYLWSNGATTKDISGMRAGAYTCSVTDLNGCVLTPSPTFTLTEPAALVINNPVTSVSTDGAYNINCFGAKTGWININVTGGSIGNYKYRWSTANGTGIIDGLKDQTSLTAGTYHLVVSDSNHCVAIKDITLSQPSVFVTQISSTNITCTSPGFNNGTIILTVSGGIAPYSYLWSNGLTTKDLSGLTPGTYKVIVTDFNGCIKTDSAKITLPPTLDYTKNLSDFNGYNISCYGLANGYININPTTGQAPFVYTWTGPGGFSSSTKNISNLLAGQYQLLIVDVNECKASEIFNISEPGKLGMTLSLPSSTAGGFNLNCSGDSTGYINVEPVNQVKTVEYLWADGIFGNNRSHLAAGNYSVIITDANNCRASATVTLSEPDSMKLVFNLSPPFCPDKPDGVILADVSGGVRGIDYSYKWQDNSTNRNLSNIPAGFYRVIVTDMNGCSIKDSVKLNPLNETCLIIPNAISPNGDLINDVWNIGMKELYPLMEVKIFNRWGEPIWRSEKGYPKPWDGKSNGSELPIDSYHYIIDLHNGSKPIIGNVTIVR